MNRLLPAAAAALACAIACGCTTSNRPGPAASIPAANTSAANTPAVSLTTPPPGTSPASMTEPVDEAAVHAAGALFAARTATEASFNATWLDHRALLTSGLAQQLRSAGTAGSDATWQLWHLHGATLTVTARPIADDLPRDTAQRAVRHLQLSLTAHGAQHWTSEPTQLGVVLTLQAIAGRWLVGAIHVDV